MKKPFTALLAAAVFPVTGGSVRSIPMDDAAMETIRLAPGRSTILRFSERPEKIVLGNTAAYKTGFVENDVTIQPRETIPTNLFVYTKGGASYGFVLAPSDRSGYDDLVKVRRRETKGRYVLGDRRAPSIHPLKAAVRSINGIDKGIVAVALSLTNEGPADIDMGDVRLFVTEGATRIASQKTYFKSPLLRPGTTMGAKIVFMPKGGSLVLHLLFGGRSSSARLPGRPR